MRSRSSPELTQKIYLQSTELSVVYWSVKCTYLTKQNVLKAKSILLRLQYTTHPLTQFVRVNHYTYNNREASEFYLIASVQLLWSNHRDTRFRLIVLQ